MLARTAALGLVLGASLLPVLLRSRGPASPARACVPEGRGAPPRRWLGCAGDPGPPRDLAGDERLVLGLPLDPNAADARELAFVPGLSRRLARAVVDHRAAHGPFETVDDLLAVKGIGPKRLERARSRLAVKGAR
jgi:competence protein ComEA